MNRQAVLMVGAGSYLPSHVMTNDDLSEFVDTDDNWIKQRTGISQRHIVAEGEKTSDLYMLHDVPWKMQDYLRILISSLSLPLPLMIHFPQQPQ